MRRAQRPGDRQLFQQPAPPLLFAEREIAGAVGAGFEQLRDDLLQHSAVLAQVERRQVKTEHLRGSNQRAQPAGGEPPGADCG